jgi:predicted DNA-binding transcriptional regulator AlpA
MGRVLKETEVSKRTGLALPTLRNWRSLGRGPAYLKMGKAVRYQEEDVEAYIRSKRIETETVTTGAA